VPGKPSASGRPETIEETAELVTAAGGRGIALRVDQIEEAEVRALFERFACGEILPIAEPLQGQGRPRQAPRVLRPAVRQGGYGLLTKDGAYLEFDEAGNERRRRRPTLLSAHYSRSPRHSYTVAAEEAALLQPSCLHRRGAVRRVRLLLGVTGLTLAPGLAVSEAGRGITGMAPPSNEIEANSRPLRTQRREPARG